MTTKNEHIEIITLLLANNFNKIETDSEMVVYSRLKTIFNYQTIEIFKNNISIKTTQKKIYNECAPGIKRSELKTNFLDINLDLIDLKNAKELLIVEFTRLITQ